MIGPSLKFENLNYILIYFFISVFVKLYEFSNKNCLRIDHKMLGLVKPARVSALWLATINFGKITLSLGFDKLGIKKV